LLNLEEELLKPKYGILYVRICFTVLQIFFYNMFFVLSVDDQYETPLKSSKPDLAAW